LNIITGALLLVSVVVPAGVAALPRRIKPLPGKEFPCDPDSLARSPQRQPSSR
jgi:hypothetical protein